jgi:hypothetical protein
VGQGAVEEVKAMLGIEDECGDTLVEAGAAHHG